MSNLNVIDVSLVAPAYNEAENIRKVVREWLDVIDIALTKKYFENFEIVICDDASTDGTLTILLDMATINPKIKVLANAKNEGAGYSLYRAVDASSGKWIFFLDTDGQFDAADLLKLWLAKSDNDGVFGIRKKQGILLHTLASRASNAFSNAIFGIQLTDSNCQFKLLKRSTIENLELKAKRMNYSFEITIKALLNEARISWLPINHRKRIYGVSKTRVIRDGISRLFFILFLKYEDQLVKNDVLIRSSSKYMGKNEAD